MEDLRYIGKRRRRLGLTQVGLAKLAGVSQSLIAKIERGTIDLAYSKAQQIFRALESQEKREEVIAEQIMTKTVIGLKKSDKLSKAFDIFKEKGISQVPILQGELCIGSISEKTILHAIQNGIVPKKLESMTVEEIMEDSIPSLGKNASLNEITALLQRNDLVLVVEKGKIKGVIVKVDLLRAISKK